MDDGYSHDSGFSNEGGSDDHLIEGSSDEGLLFAHRVAPRRDGIFVSPCLAATALTFWMLLGMFAVGFVWVGFVYSGTAGPCYGLGDKSPQVCFLKKLGDNRSWAVAHNVRYFSVEAPRVEVGEPTAGLYSPGQTFALAGSSVREDRVEWLVVGCLSEDVYFVVYRSCPVTCFVNATAYKKTCTGCS